MTFCSQYNDAIQELADGTLGPVRRAELQTHLDMCDQCRSLAADLQKIRATAASLDPVTPPDRAWKSIANQLRQEGRAAAAPRISTHRAAVLAIAASLLIAVGGSLYMLRTYEPANSTGNATPTRSVQDIRSEIAADLTAADRRYESAIVKLEEAVRSDDQTIDPQTAEILKKNLQVIDQAIAESRSALQDEPQSAPARDSLFEALRRKVNLLQDTIALMNDMRKGNSAGAAQLVDPGGKS